MYWKFSHAVWTSAKSLRVNSFPFLSTFDRWTTLARLDFGIVLVIGVESGFVVGVLFSNFLENYNLGREIFGGLVPHGRHRKTYSKRLFKTR
jgi:hypothetical protein